MTTDCQTFLRNYSSLERPCDPKGSRSVDGWTHYGGVATFHRSAFGKGSVRETGPSGGSARAPLWLCVAEGLLAVSLSVFLYVLWRVTSPAPSEHHMDHLNATVNRVFSHTCSAKGEPVRATMGFIINKLDPPINGNRVVLPVKLNILNPMWPHLL